MVTMFSDAPKRRVLVSEANRTIPDPTILRPIERPILNRLAHVVGQDGVRVGQVGYGARVLVVRPQI